MDYRRDWVVGIDKYGNYFRHGPLSATTAGFVHSQESQRGALHVTIMRVPEGAVPPHADPEHVESRALDALPTAQARERVRIQGIVREELARTFRDARYAQRVAYSEMGRSDGTIPPTGGPITG